MRSVHLSVVVITFGRPRQCLVCLESLVKALQEAPEISAELIVGINGDDPGTKMALAERFSNENMESVQIKENFVPSMPSAFRNRLLPYAKGEWVYFIDDDASVPTDIFKNFTNVIEEFPSVAALGGPNLNPPGSTLFQRSSGVTLASSFATWFSSARYEKRGKPRTSSERELILCNLFVRREVLSDKPFPEELWCAEENWFLQSLDKNGHVSVYHPEIIVWHERRPTLLSFCKQIFRYGFGRGQIFKRDFSGAKAAHFVPVIFVTYFLFTISKMMTIGAWFLGLAPLVAYLTLCALVPVFTYGHASYKERILSSGLFPVIHISYGFGLFWGLVRG